MSDEVVPLIYHPAARQRFHDVDLVLGCGDLPPSYLDYIVSVLDVPCFYVPGNHDGEPEYTDYGKTLFKPPGGVNIDGRVVRHDGLALAGLGGSIWYNGGKHQYTQSMMTARVYALVPRILWYRRSNGYGMDILITHSPPAGIHDATGAHVGFKALRWLIERFPPRYHIHGHVHRNYRMSAAFETQVGSTIVINTAGYRVLTIERLASVRRAGYNQP
ncbi:MAG TPA: metallophosphoesterase [Herpetosiphonaceae bacterium]